MLAAIFWNQALPFEFQAPQSIDTSEANKDAPVVPVATPAPFRESMDVDHNVSLPKKHALKKHAHITRNRYITHIL